MRRPWSPQAACWWLRDVVQAPNDKQQLAPMLDKISALPDELGEAETLLADSGYFSEANVEVCAAAGIEPLIPQGRQTHYPPLSERFAKAPSAPENPTPLETMAHRLKTPEAKISTRCVSRPRSQCS